MPHKDQFTATGPAFTGAGFPRAAFSTGTEGTDSTYGVNVQGSECGVYGESWVGLPQGELGTTRTAKKGTGVCGIGDTYGVTGRGVLAGVSGFVTGRSDTSGVVGSNFGDGPGVAGFSHSQQVSDFLGTGIGMVGASNKGVGVVGLSIKKVDLRDEESGGGVVIPDKNQHADGEGTGVMGASGFGDGVRGQSHFGTGVHGSSEEGDGGQFESNEGAGLIGISANNRGGVFRTGKNVAQIQLEPIRQDTTFPILPQGGKVGDLILIRNTAMNQDGQAIDISSLWLCIPKNSGDEKSDRWQQVLLGATVIGTS